MKQKYTGVFRTRANEKRILRLLLRDERPQEYVECLSLIAYILGKQQFNQGLLQIALQLLERADAFAQEFGFCQYWHTREHFDMRSLLVITTLKVKGVAAVPLISSDKLLPGTDQFLQHTTQSYPINGLWLYRGNHDITYRQQTNLEEMLGTRAGRESECVLDSDDSALQVDNQDVLQLAIHANSAKNPIRAARANLLLAQHTAKEKPLEEESISQWFHRSRQLAKKAGDGILEVRAGLKYGHYLKTMGSLSQGNLELDKAFCHAEQNGYKHLLKAN